MRERTALVHEVAQAIALFQNATHLVDDAASACLGINPTDRRLLRLLFAHGRMSAGRLASAASLSPGATTAAVDRLERAKFARRIRDDGDRRGVLVELTPEALRRIEEIYGPVGRLGMERLARYSDADLRVLRDFLTEGYQFQVEQAERILSESASERL